MVIDRHCLGRRSYGLRAESRVTPHSPGYLLRLVCSDLPISDPVFVDAHDFAHARGLVAKHRVT